jgi:hypothetical protein
MTIEYLDQFQPRILDVQQKILDVREIPEIRVSRRYRTISAGRSWRARRRPLKSGGGWLMLILIALIVGAVGSHMMQPPPPNRTLSSPIRQPRARPARALPPPTQALPPPILALRPPVRRRRPPLRHIPR